MLDTLSAPSVSTKVPTEQELQSHHQTLQTMLQAHGELTRHQSDYAVHLVNKLERTVQAPELPSRQRYYDYYMNHDLDHLRDGLPVFDKPGSLYQGNFRRYLLPHDRSNSGDEYKAVQEFAKVKSPEKREEMKPAMRLVTGLALLMSDKEMAFADTAAKLTREAGYTSLPEELTKRVFKTAQLDQLNVDFKDYSPVPV